MRKKSAGTIVLNIKLKSHKKVFKKRYKENYQGPSFRKIKSEIFYIYLVDELHKRNSLDFVIFHSLVIKSMIQI